MRLPIGYDDFANIRERQLDFVDKSLFIKEVVDDTAQVVVITRPRRFGKTFNLSMLHYFLVKKAFGKETSGLFADLKIAKIAGNYMAHQGKYPVIFITFKDVKNADPKVAYQLMCNSIKGAYLEHDYLLDSAALSNEDKNDFLSVLQKGMDMEPALLISTLKNLTRYLSKHYGVNAWLLIDEYDTPIHSSYTYTYTYGYYDEMIGIMRGLFGSVLKSNPYLNRGVVTGILRIAKESLFSGLNNLEVYSLLRNEYGDCFGFTPAEVEALLEKTQLQAQSEAIRNWYNGYLCGETVIFNPWSILNCIKQKGLLQPYWVNTSDNQLIRDLVIGSDEEFKALIERLIKDEEILQLIDENIIFSDLKTNQTAVWSLFLMAGYLKVISIEKTDRGNLCQLKIPNQEIRNLYRQMIERWLSGSLGVQWYANFLECLLLGDIVSFEKSLQQLMTDVVSYHDTSCEPEAFYHGLKVGFTASLYQDKNYELRSNRESGEGRYDYMILSLTPEKPSIIMEFKRIKQEKDDKKSMQNLNQAAKKAFSQIEKNNYLAEAKQRGSKKIIRLGMAFCGKSFKIYSK